MIGQTISHYTIMEKLGEGGMGIVYKAEDLKLKRIVALKFLPLGISQTPEDHARFQQEAEALSALNHPNIATIFDVEEVDDRRFLALEYIAGGTLKTLTRKRAAANEPFSIQEVAGYGAQIAAGLAHAHAAGIVHRDVKPDNVMMTPDGNLKLTDFGLAKFRKGSQLTQAGSTLGTAAYMSPEQIRGEDVDQRSDLFSLGILLFELLTLHLPFKGDHPVALAYSIANEEPGDVGQWRTGVPEYLGAVVRKCLAKNPEDRFQNASEVVENLRISERMSAAHAAVPAASKTGKFPRFASIAIVAVLFISIAVYVALRPKEAVAAANAKTIAVLPFSNMSGNPEDEYFADGVTEDILANLSKVRDLNVISRTTMTQYKGTKKSLREIGAELNAGVVLQGSVRHAGGDVRIVAQLIDAATDRNLWADTYDRAFRDIFSIQSDVAQKVAAALQANLSISEKARIEKIPTTNIEAYNTYLKGDYLIQKATQAEIDQGYRLMVEASRLDSTFALPYIGIALYYSMATDFYLAPALAMPEVRKASEKAIQMDPELSEGHTQLGWYNLWFTWDWNAADTELLKAIQLNPKYDMAHFFYSWYLTSQGRLEDALHEDKTFAEVRPLSPWIAFSAFTLYAGRRYDQALAVIQKSMEVDSSFAFQPLFRGLCHLQQKNFPQGIADMKRAHTLFGSPWTLGRVGYAYALAGQKDAAIRILDTLREQSRTTYVPSDIVASVYVALGDRNHAFEYLEKAYTERAGWLLWIKVDPIWDPIRNDARFTALLTKMKLQ